MKSRSEMSEVTYVHSLSTRPMLTNCYGMDGLKRLLVQVWYFSLSVAYMKRLGARIVLHTDSLGKAVLGHLPYNDIYLTLDKEETIHPRYWASAKFRALEAEKAPCLHLDGDVFIKRSGLLRMIEESLMDNDLLFQSYDAARMYSMELPLYEKEASFCKEHYCEGDGEDAYNTGILGFSNDATRQVVVENYLTIAQYFSDKYKKELDEGVYLTPDLIAEQKMLRGIMEAKGLRGWMLLKDKQDAIELGYQHVYTVDKFEKIEYCKEALKVVSPDIYAQTEKVARL